MSHLLFSTGVGRSSTVNHKPTELPRQLFHIIRGTSDSIEALNLFLKLVFEHPDYLDGDVRNQDGFHEFDAHVGDTACQLRACMLLDVIKILKEPASSPTVTVIKSTISDLEQLLANSRQLLAQLLELDWNKIRAGALDEMKITKSGLTVDELLARLGWTSHAAFHQGSRVSSLASLKSASSSHSLASGVSGRTSFLITPTSSVCESEYAADTDVSFDHSNLSEPDTIITLLIYSYVLTKYRRLQAFGGVYQATLRPEIAFETSQLMVGREFERHFVSPNKRVIGEEFVTLQRYVSELSCAWLEHRSRSLLTLGPRYRELLKSTMRTSGKGVKSASNYVSYLILRSLWAEEAFPFIIITTRFCPSGFHRNYFRVTMQTDRGQGPVPPVQPEISWHLDRLSGIGLDHLRRCSDPYIIASGNSVNGSASEYFSRLSTAQLHNCDECDDNEEHCAAMLASDQDRVVQAIFAEHRHYAFGLADSEALLGEEVVVQCLMDEFIPGLSIMWKNSKAEAETLGTGPSYKLYMWQHVTLESPSRFLARVEGSDRPWIVNCALNTGEKA